MKTISSWWTTGQTKEKAKHITAQVLQADPVLQLLRQKLEQEVQEIDKHIDKHSFLLFPGTKERLVSKLAEKRKLKAVLKLIQVTN